MTTINLKAFSAAIALIKPAIAWAQKALPDPNLPFVTLRFSSGELAIMVPTLKRVKASDPVPVGVVSIPAEISGDDASVLVNGKFLSSIKSLLDKSKRATKVSISVKEGEAEPVQYKVGLLKPTTAKSGAEMIEWVTGLPLEKGQPYQYGTYASAEPHGGELSFSKEEAKQFKKYAESIDRTFKVWPGFDEPPPPIPAVVTVKVNGTQLDDDFAQVPTLGLGPVRTTGGFKVPTSDAKAMLKPIASNMSKDTSRPHLNAALFSVGKHGLRMVSTDGHRLMAATFATETKEEAEIVVPAPLVEFLAGAVSKSKFKTVSFSAKDDVITASVDLAGMTAAIRVPDLNLTFPAYNQIVPRKQDAYVTMTLEVKAALYLVKLFATLKAIISDRVQGILIGVTPDGMPALRMEGGDLPEYNPAVLLPGVAKIHPGEEPVVVGVDANYIVEALLGFEDKVKLNLRGELDPMLFYGKVGNVDLESVVMPMRVSKDEQKTGIVIKPISSNGTKPMPAADMLAMATYANYFTQSSGYTIAVLESILVQSLQGRLSMSANDLYSTASTSVPCAGPSFALAIKSKDLVSAISAFSNDALLSLAWNNQHEKSPGLLIRDIEGGIQFGITGVSADQFPPLPEISGQPAGVVSSEALIPLVQGVEATASRDQSRAHMNAIAWRLNKDFWEAIATDGHRATWGRIALPAGTGPTLNGEHQIMKLEAALGIPKMIDSLTGPVQNIELEVGKVNSSLSIHDTASGLERIMTYKMVEGKSPPFEQVYEMASGFVTAVSANTKQLQEAAALIVAADKNTEKEASLAFEASGGRLVVRSIKVKAKTTLPLVFDGQPPSFAMNPAYLVQLCKACSDDELTLFDSGVKNFASEDPAPGPFRCWFSNGPYVRLDWLCMPMRQKDIGTDAALASVPPPVDMDPPPAPLVSAGARPAKPKPARKQRSQPTVQPVQPSAVRLYILDRDAFAKLTELEGEAWAKWQKRHADEPSTFIDSLDAYKIMRDMLASGELEPTVQDEVTGIRRPVMIGDVSGSDGFSGANEEVYVVTNDGEILVFGDTLSQPKLAKARKVLRVVGDTSSRTSARQSVERTSVKRSSVKASAKPSSAKRSSVKASVKRSSVKASVKRSSVKASAKRSSVKASAKRSSVKASAKRILHRPYGPNASTVEGAELVSALDALMANKTNFDWTPDEESKAVLKWEGNRIGVVTHEDGQWIVRYKASDGSMMAYPIATISGVVEWIKDTIGDLSRKRPAPGKTPTYKQAQSAMLKFLRQQGWKVDGLMKTPQATHPSGDLRLYFRPQTIMVATGRRLRLEEAFPIIPDIRKITGSDLVKYVERISEKQARIREEKSAQPVSVRESKTKFSDHELMALCTLIKLKPSARPEVFRRTGLGEYDAQNPFIVSLVRKGMLSINQAGSIMADKDKVKAFLKTQAVPKNMRERFGWRTGCDERDFRSN